MEEPGSLIGELFEKTEQYTRNTLELQKLKAIDKIADVLSTLAMHMVWIVIFGLFFMSLNVGIALWIGDALGSSYLGFFIVSGFYGLAALVFWIFKGRWIKKPLRNEIITQALN